MSDLNALNLEPGEVVGGYTLVSRLGAGAMGSVWRVRDDGGTTYAMKILRDSLADESGTSNSANTAAHDPDLKPNITPRERLRREAMALKKVNHPGVCGIVDMELDDSLAFIVTELIEGRNLKEDVEVNGRYIGDDLERLARKLIDATKAVHAAGIVHRDIKPTNVMVSAAGPVLVDFGIAMGEGESHVTRTGLVMGTPGFIAPEIIDGAESDEMTDWWSVASVLAFAAIGAPVFGTKPMMAVLEREASGNANLTGLPAGTMAAFRSALNPDRSKRCTPNQLLNAIAVDALDPSVWQGTQAGPFAAGAIAGTAATIAADAVGTEAMPPFGATADADSDNPRAIWRQDDYATAAIDSSSSPTLSDGTATEAFPATTNAGSNLSSDDEATQLVGNATENATEAIRPAAQRTVPISGEPPVAPTTPLSERTAVLPAPQPVPQPLQPTPQPVPLGQNGWNPADGQSTAVDPAIRPALQHVINQTAQCVPTEALIQGPPAPNPADVRRGMYLQRGVLPLFLFAVPLAVLAASFPLIALIAAEILLWLLLTLAYNTESQLEREGRRGGKRKSSDSLIRVATLPWHIVKALLLSIPKLLLLTIVYLAGIAVAVAALGLPVRTISWYFTASRGVPVPLLDDIPFSVSGLALGGFMAIGWLITVFGPQSAMPRLGAGVLRGIRHNDLEPMAQPGADGLPAASIPRQGSRGTVLLTLWIIITLVLCALPLLGMPISWVPLA